jgi:hypothetical protein
MGSSEHGTRRRQLLYGKYTCSDSCCELEYPEFFSPPNIPEQAWESTDRPIVLAPGVKTAEEVKVTHTCKGKCKAIPWQAWTAPGV